MTNQAALGLDGADPLVVVITWCLTEAASRLMTKAQASRARHALPAFAVLAAIGARAAIDAVGGEPITFDAVLRGLGAAGVAALGHSQMREVSKARAKRKPKT